MELTEEQIACLAAAIADLLLEANEEQTTKEHD